MNIQKLKGLIVEKNMNVASLSKEINMNQSTFYRKLKEPEKFTVEEVRLIATTLKMNTSELNEIFFTEIVA